MNMNWSEYAPAVFFQVGQVRGALRIWQKRTGIDWGIFGRVGHVQDSVEQFMKEMWNKYIRICPIVIFSCGACSEH